MKKFLKLIKRVNKYLRKKNKCLQTFLKTILNAMKKFKLQWQSVIFLLAITFYSCGSTKVSVDKPASGTMTTITVTTNNPITTNVNPNVELKNNK